MSCSSIHVLILLVAASVFTAVGCSTAPGAKGRASFMADVRGGTQWFEENVPELRTQIDNSAAYMIFPSVGQWEFLIGGWQFGRGMLSQPTGDQTGWAAVNTGSIGFQAGVRGFRMLVVAEDEATLRRFLENRLPGSASGVVVVAKNGRSARAPFEHGVAVYQGASTGLMAGVNIGLDCLQYKPLKDG